MGFLTKVTTVDQPFQDGWMEPLSGGQHCRRTVAVATDDRCDFSSASTAIRKIIWVDQGGPADSLYLPSSILFPLRGISGESGPGIFLQPLNE